MKFIFTIIFSLFLFSCLLAQDTYTLSGYMKQIGITVYQLTPPPSSIQTDHNLFHQVGTQAYGKYSLNSKKALRFAAGYQAIDDFLRAGESACCDRVINEGMYWGGTVSIGIEGQWRFGKVRPFAYADLNFKYGKYNGSRSGGFAFISTVYYHTVMSGGVMFGGGVDISLFSQLGLSLSTGFESFYAHQAIQELDILGIWTNRTESGVDYQFIPIQRVGLYWAF